MNTPFRWPVRIYWEDTDAGGVVYHANYLKFFERARSEWLRAQGLDQAALVRERGLVFVVYAMQIEFLKPARLDDALWVELAAVQIRRASLGFEHRLVDDPATTCYCRATAEVACLDAEAFKPKPIPPDLFRGAAP